MTGLSLTALEFDKREAQKDLVAFTEAYDTIRRRLLEVSETSRTNTMERWSGTWACIGSLELSISMLEKQILEIDVHIQQVLSGEIPNLDVPSHPGFTVIDGGAK